MQCYKQAARADPLILEYMLVNLEMFHSSALSDAEHGFTSMQKGGRRVSTPQEHKKQSILDLSQYQRMVILYSRQADTVVNKPSTLRRARVPFLQEKYSDYYSR